MVRLRLFSSLRDLAGAKEVEVEGDGMLIKEALVQFAERYGEKAQRILFDQHGDVWPSVLLLVNGEAAEDGVGTRVKAGDVVSILLPTAGG